MQKLVYSKCISYSSLLTPNSAFLGEEAYLWFFRIKNWKHNFRANHDNNNDHNEEGDYDNDDGDYDNDNDVDGCPC